MKRNAITASPKGTVRPGGSSKDLPQGWPALRNRCGECRSVRIALTGIRHGTDRAMLLGLMGEKPDDVDPTTIDAKLDEIRQKQVVRLLGQYPIVFNQKYDLSFRKNEILSGHSNRMRFLGREHAKPIWKLIFENEKSLRSEQEIFGDMSRIWHAMKDCTRRDLETKGSLGAGLKIQPRAPELY